MAMDLEIKKLWIKALRSGDYLQGYSYLQQEGNRFCCLGVLSDLGIKAGVIEESLQKNMCYAYGDQQAVSKLCYEIKKWSGITFDYGDLEKKVTVHDSKCYSLASLNDAGFTFQQIADVIEEQF